MQIQTINSFSPTRINWDDISNTSQNTPQRPSTPRKVQARTFIPRTLPAGTVPCFCCGDDIPQNAIKCPFCGANT